MRGPISRWQWGHSGRAVLFHYGGAALCVATALLVALGSRAVTDAEVLLLAAVAVAAWFCGLRAALFASLLATLALDYLFTPPLYTVSLEFSHVPRLVIFTVLAAMFAAASAARRRAEQSLKGARAELESRVREQTADLRRINQRLATQYAVTRVLAASESLDRAAPELLAAIGTTMAWQWGALWKVDRDAGVLRRESLWHAPEVDAGTLAASGHLTFARGRGLPGTVWETGRAQWITDAARDGSFVRFGMALTAGLHGAVAFPIFVEGETIGVVEFFSDTARAAEHEELDTLSAIGSQIGQFIERKRAEQERERLRDREQAALADAVAARHRFEELVNSIEGIVWEADPGTFQFSFVSRQAERVLGYPIERWTSEPTFWADHIHQDDREWAIKLCTTATAARTNHAFEYRMVAADGRIVWLRDLVNVVVEGPRVTLRGVMFDITARKHDERSLRERADLLNLTHDTVFVRDLDHVITYWNRGAEERYGWTASEAVGKVSHTLMQTIFPAPLKDIAAEFFRNGRWEGELLHTTRDGSQVVVASRWSLQRDVDGRPLAILETNNDVTERRRAEEALRDSEEQWRAVFENNPTMYFMVDGGGIVLSVNPFGAEQLGYTVNELIGESVLKVFLEEDWPAVTTMLGACLDRDGQVMTWELRKIRKDHSVIWVRETARAMRRRKGDPVVLIACEDITSRKRAEADLRESERRYRHIFQATGVSIWEEDFSQVKAALDRLNASGVDDLRAYIEASPGFVDEAISLVRIVDVNDATLKLFGVQDKEELLASLATVFTPETRDVFAEELIAIAEGRTSYEGEAVLRTLTGQRLAVLFSVSFPPPDASFDAVLVSIMDITARKRAEQELEELAGRLIHAQEEERSRIGRELHDHVSQMLGVLTIRIDQLRAEPTTPPQIGAALAELRHSTAQVTEDIHRLSHRLHSSTLDYLGLLPALQKLVGEFSNRHGIDIELSHHSMPAILPSDISLCLFRVAEESLANVAKHSGARSARVAVYGAPDAIHLTIEDTGSGFDAGSLESKAGLGFVSMRERLRVLHGTMRVRSTPSRGTAVDIWVPISSLSAAGSADAPRDVHGSATQGGPLSSV